MADYLRRFRDAAYSETPGGKYSASALMEIQKALHEWACSDDPIDPEMRMFFRAALEEVVKHRRSPQLFEPLVTSRPTEIRDETALIPAVRYAIAAGGAGSVGRGAAVREIAREFRVTERAVRVWLTTLQVEPGEDIGIDRRRALMVRAAKRYQGYRKAGRK
jgi:hypothetical protein